jgi:hypothetical protein
MMNLTCQRIISKHQKIVFTSSCRMTSTASTITWSWHSNVTYVAHYRKGHLTKASLLLKSTLRKQSTGRLLEDTTKSPYVYRHGIFLMIITNVNVMLIGSFNNQCQHTNSSCGNGYTFSCHSILCTQINSKRTSQVWCNWGAMKTIEIVPPS